MKSPRKIFHIISYAQYGFILAALALYFPLIKKVASEGIFDFSILNNVLILMGIALSFSTLQDTRKTQNKISRKIWEHPTKGKVALVLMSFMAFVFIAVGLYALFKVNSAIPAEVGVGIIVLGIGLVGVLKTAIEMFENHRLDKNPKS